MGSAELGESSLEWRGVISACPSCSLAWTSTVASPVEVNETIIGGWDCKPNEAKYQVLLTDRKRNVKCGGSLLSSKWVLTAAHCDSSDLKVYVGLQDLKDLNDMKKKFQPVKVKSKIKHPEYVKRELLNDIMLIKLKKEIKTASLVHLPTECKKHGDKAPEKKDLLVAGWGSLGGGENPKSPTKLQCVIIQKAKCPSDLDPPITPDAFCAGKGNQKTRCGDSGGGLVYKKEVYGVVQSDFDPDDDYPSIFTSVCFHLAWIKKETKLS
ncbi:trypsin-3-like [Megalops cyprinoides]|uniref:trypsin-3-like n=1 Tax=Megalops cyprinoides TaxID=118141 RepID=UPI001865605E|nr:trypsin-3-like [Megalops cyprinoides]